MSIKNYSIKNKERKFVYMFVTVSKIKMSDSKIILQFQLSFNHKPPVNKTYFREEIIFFKIDIIVTS